MSAAILREAFSQSILSIFSIAVVVSAITFVAVLLMKQVPRAGPAQGPGTLPGEPENRILGP